MPICWSRTNIYNLKVELMPICLSRTNVYIVEVELMPTFVVGLTTRSPYIRVSNNQSNKFSEKSAKVRYKTNKNCNMSHRFTIAKITKKSKRIIVMTS